jgi:hypothetical protein
MSASVTATALAWTMLATLVLLAWPRALARLALARPAWVEGTPMPDRSRLADADAGGLGGRPVAAIGLAAMGAAAGLLPFGRSLHAADLDAGLLWFALLLMLASPWVGYGLRRASAGLVLTLGLAAAPVVMRTASLNLADVVIAQQGGVGSWYLLRDPMLALCAVIYLLAAAAAWPPMPRAGHAGLDYVLRATVAAGQPLLLAVLFAVLFLGGWWAFVPYFDVVPVMPMIGKTVAAVAVMVLLRRRLPAVADARRLHLALPGAALVAGTAAVAWMVMSGAGW